MQSLDVPWSGVPSLPGITSESGATFQQKQNKTLVEEDRSLLKNQGICVVILLLALSRGFL